jgi:acyl-CoA hydrolase
MVATERISDLDLAVERILARCGPELRIGAPLGLGKPNRLLNALYRRVKSEPKLSLTLMTALSLARPQPKPGLEARFAGPFLARHFGADYPDLEFIADLRAGALPANVRIVEFYIQSGAMLGNAHVQRNYASINYTHVARDVAARRPNLLLQQVARRGERLSLSSNADTTLDLLDRMAAAGAPRPYVVAVVHPELPFIGNDAELGLEFADLLLEEPGPAHALFALPREAVLQPEFALGLHAASLVRDGGSLQIGIGALSDALVHALLLRQRDNGSYRAALASLRAAEEPAVVRELGGEAPFERGLYGASEMVMDGFMHLRRAGVLKRRVFDHLGLQRLLNDGRIGEVADEHTLERLIEAELVPTTLDRPSVEWLVHFGLLPESAHVRDGVLHLYPDLQMSSDLMHASTRRQLATAMRGRRLRNGRFLHGAFYLGSKRLYEWLRGLEGEEFEGLSMTRVSHINELYGGRELLDIAQRHHARFFNTCMMQTLLGASVSDGLADGEIVSGVGGQYNFVAMAHALESGRSILMLRATREARGQVQSNIVWSYAHVTIPRHLRDLVVTEYGIADLRGASDEEVIQRTLAISDARFIDRLAATAKQAGKLAADFVIPDAWRRNTPEAVTAVLAPYRARGMFETFPFGSDFDAEELALLPALKRLRGLNATRGGRLSLLWSALTRGAPGADVAAGLARLGLSNAMTRADKLLARAVAAAMRDTRSG